MSVFDVALRAEESRGSVSVVIPTYCRGRVLLDTLDHLLGTRPRPTEILVVDQTPRHMPETEARLQKLDADGSIRWLRLDRPSIPGALNAGLLRAKEEVVLYLDDDVVPDIRLVGAHLHAHAEDGAGLVAGRVLQPWDVATGGAEEDALKFRFSSTRRCWVREFMGGNFSVKRSLALALGGFDENFVRVAYRFEADFAERLLAAGGRILFEPAATIHHLKARDGGTRAFGDHLRTMRPSHTVGEYYYLLRRWRSPESLRRLLSRPVRAIRTRHHLCRPWWIPVTLTAEVLGFCWAIRLVLRGPHYLKRA